MLLCSRYTSCLTSKLQILWEFGQNQQIYCYSVVDIVLLWCRYYATVDILPPTQLKAVPSLLQIDEIKDDAVTTSALVQLAVVKASIAQEVGVCNFAFQYVDFIDVLSTRAKQGVIDKSY